MVYRSVSIHRPPGPARGEPHVSHRCNRVRAGCHHPHAVRRPSFHAPCPRRARPPTGVRLLPARREKSQDMTRLGMVAAAAATLAAVVLAPTVGQAQSVDAAARDLRTHDVTFETGAVTDQDLADLDRVTAQLQADGGYTKVVVL